jgi:hypothetical protein
LGLGVLIGAAVILSAAAKAQNPQTIINHKAIVNAVAAQRGILWISGIVIAMDVQYGTPGHGYQET